jgi:Uma2 family endonuclease
VDSESIDIETFRVNEKNHWELEEYNSVMEELYVKAIDEKISIADIYEGVKIPEL